jgi:cytochrome c-type biogenesis protein CcmH
VKMKATLVTLLLAASAMACSGAAGPRAASSPPPAGSGETPASQAPALPPGHPPIGPGATPAKAADEAQTRVTGTVELSPALTAGPGDVLYVIAKQGTTTLAVQRIEKPAFPLAFTLSAADAMVSGVAFEGPVDLTARLSRSGDAIPSAGDLEGVTRGVAVPSAGAQVTIDTTRR